MTGDNNHGEKYDAAYAAELACDADLGWSLEAAEHAAFAHGPDGCWSIEVDYARKDQRNKLEEMVNKLLATAPVANVS